MELKCKTNYETSQEDYRKKGKNLQLSRVVRLDIKSMIHNRKNK